MPKTKEVRSPWAFQVSVWRSHLRFVEEASTIKLGLGDFVFYSVLVSRAAMFDFAAMIGCMVTVLMVRLSATLASYLPAISHAWCGVQGLGGTLFLLGIYNKALPALPISILLSVTVYFWMRFAYFPFLESYLTGVGFA
jgi:presenilin 1